MKENSLWFRHDANASLDGRLLKLRSRHGFEGIGIFWFLLENLYQNDGYLDEEEVTILLSGIANAKQVLNDCFQLSLFNHVNDGTFMSERLLEEISRRQHIIEKRKSAGRKGGLVSAKKKVIANAQANAQAKLKRVEESIVEESKEEKTTDISLSANADLNAKTIDEIEEFLLWLNREKIFPCEKRLSPAARKKWLARRGTYSPQEIYQAFSNLLNEPDMWKIKNNGFRSLAWWLHSDERIEDMKNCHLKRGKRGVALISDEYGKTIQ